MVITEIGFNIIAATSTCDQGSNNRKAYRLLGATESKPYTFINNKKVYLLYDYCHLFKIVRNILLKSNIHIKDEIVSWNILKTLVENEQPQIIKSIYTLTSVHVNPNSFQKLSVGIATQVFSATVATSINVAIAVGCFRKKEEVVIATSTANFITKMNQLFDNLNGSSKKGSSNPNAQPISLKTTTLQNIKDSMMWIKDWQSAGKMKKPYCFSGLIKTLCGLIELWDDIKHEQEYLKPYHFNSDPCENFISMLRIRRGSYVRNPAVQRL